MQPMYIIHDDVIAGRLVPLLTEWELQRLTINIAYPTRRHLPAKVRCFVDFLVEKFAQMDFERRWTAWRAREDQDRIGQNSKTIPAPARRSRGAPARAAYDSSNRARSGQNS